MASVIRNRKVGWIRQLWKWLCNFQGLSYVARCLIVVPMILGMIGFYLAGEEFLHGAFLCVSMYCLNYADPPPNVFVELARWLAPVATASGLAMLISAMNRGFRNWLARRSGRSVAVFGPEEEKAPILRQLGWRGISVDQKLIKAHNYILVGEEQANLDFYQRNIGYLKDREVHLKCHSLPGQAASAPNLHLFCPEEMAARSFWSKYCPLELLDEQTHQLKIVLIGFGKLGQELLLSGLQRNIFHPQQKIEYHIFGEEDGFSDVYWQLSQIDDPVIFHEESWAESRELLMEAGMIIVAQQEEQLGLLNRLQLALPNRMIHVLAAEINGAALMEQMICYDWKSEYMSVEHIMSTRLHELAKRLNLRYAMLYSNVEEIDGNLEPEWDKLNTFTRYSNISAAEYQDVRARMVAGQEMTPELEDALGELEHIRWCRYHFLNNWSYGIPANGKAKDGANRIHKLLIPYADLPESEKEKDRENVRYLMELDAKMKENKEDED
ncbi:MAG: hypothetical protein E7436_00725 [Ruminococcaceae bacterium]|nr:hypothetical protein [Oscillospiraceae bacterium]